jgi:hypothetical protein
MPSKIDICNLALAHIGQDANISSIDPPEGSADAEHCARFYPIALSMLLESSAWTFSTKRVQLAEVATIDPWLHGYSLPADYVKAWRVLPLLATDDHQGVRYLIENGVIYTDEPQARLVYTWGLTDTTKFSPGFVTALSWLLASYIAGPVLKDTSGVAQGRAYQMYERERGKAAADNANSDRNPPPYMPASIRARFQNSYPQCGVNGGDTTAYPGGFTVL